MRDENGKDIETAGPSILYFWSFWRFLLQVMEKRLYVIKIKRGGANYRQGKFRDVKLARQQKAKLENMFANDCWWSWT